MNLTKEFTTYYKNNPKGYWFKRKLYGWGWMPVKWQGWLLIAIYLVLVLFFALTIDENSPPNEVVFTFLLPLTLLTITLVKICYLKGESPKWQWGLPKKK